MSRQKKEVEPGNDTSKNCVRALYKAVLDRDPPERAVHILSRYQYAGDAIRDLLDYCSARELYSRASVAGATESFISALLDYLQQEHRLPGHGYFSHRAGSHRSSATPRQTLMRLYWELDHGERMARRTDNEVLAAWFHQRTDRTRTRLRPRNLRTTLCHEIAMQAIRTILEMKVTTANIPMEELKEWCEHSFSAAESLSYSWRLPRG